MSVPISLIPIRILYIIVHPACTRYTSSHHHNLVLCIISWTSLPHCKDIACIMFNVYVHVLSLCIHKFR